MKPKDTLEKLLGTAQRDADTKTKEVIFRKELLEQKKADAHLAQGRVQGLHEALQALETQNNP